MLSYIRGANTTTCMHNLAKGVSQIKIVNIKAKAITRAIIWAITMPNDHSYSHRLSQSQPQQQPVITQWQRSTADHIMTEHRTAATTPSCTVVKLLSEPYPLPDIWFRGKALHANTKGVHKKYDLSRASENHSVWVGEVKALKHSFLINSGEKPAWIQW